MSNPQDSESTEPTSVDDVVDSANESLAEAAAAGAEVPDSESNPAVDPDLAAFEEAEKSHPGVFSWARQADEPAQDADASDNNDAGAASDAAHEASDSDAAAPTDASVGSTDEDAAETRILPRSDNEQNTSADNEATSVIAAPAPSANDDETRRIDSTPAVATFAEEANQPVFVQAPEAPRARGNRGLAGTVGLLATVIFAALYLGATWLSAFLNGDAKLDETLVDGIIAPLMTVSFWVPVAVFFLGFWLLGAFINRGGWGKWVVFGLLAGFIAWGGHLLGVLVAAPFWMLTASQGTELLLENLFSPLAIAAFIIGRELTIWFGAWVAKRGARKKALNAADMAEYERTIEAGPRV